jgi:hypothetical protein
MCKRRNIYGISKFSLQMVMDFNGMGLVCDSPVIRGKELDDFLRKFNVLTSSEIKRAFEVTFKDLLGILSQTVPCVGCRRRLVTCVFIHSLL